MERRRKEGRRILGGRDERRRVREREDEREFWHRFLLLSLYFYYRLSFFLYSQLLSKL